MRPPQSLEWRLPELRDVVDLLASRFGTGHVPSAEPAATPPEPGHAVRRRPPVRPATARKA
jgi:hypothetical protein